MDLMPLGARHTTRYVAANLNGKEAAAAHAHLSEPAMVVSPRLWGRPRRSGTVRSAAIAAALTSSVPAAAAATVAGAIADGRDEDGDALGPANSAAIAVSIALFLALSVLSGRALWRRDAAADGAAQDLKEEAAAGALGGRPGQRNVDQLPPYAPVRSAASRGGVVSNGGAGVGPQAPIGRADDSAAMSIGAEMRRRLFRLMFAASTLRVCSLVAELAAAPAVAELPPSAGRRRALAAFLWLPSLVFVSLYGVVLLFWVQLCYACGGRASPWPRRVFFAANMLLYAGFAVLIVLAKTSGQVWRVCDLAEGVLYFAGLFGIAHYGMQLTRFFRLQGGDDDFADGFSTGGSRRQLVLRRVSLQMFLLALRWM